MTALVWLVPLVDVLVTHDAPKLLDTYTTTVTDVLDLGVLVPAMVLGGVLLLRGAALGYALAVVLIVLLLLIAATIIAGTLFQVAADVSFTPGEIVGPIAGFLILAAIGCWLLVRLLRDVAPVEAR